MSNANNKSAVVPQTKLVKYLAFQLNLPETILKRVLKEVITFVCVEILAGAKVVNVPSLGVFVFDDTTGDVRLKPNASLKGIVNLYTSGIPTIEYRKEPDNIRSVPQDVNLVQESFLNYLRNDFVYENDWTHPGTNEIFEHLSIRKAIVSYSQLDREGYTALWALWNNQHSRAELSLSFDFSPSSLSRRWKRAVNTVLLILRYPHLEPELPIAIYNITVSP